MTGTLKIQILDCPEAPQVACFKGRDAWCLRELLDAGPSGCTPIERVGPRWSAYVFNLRKAGLSVVTQYEGHGGDYPGRHARYILRSQVRVVARGEVLDG